MVQDFATQCIPSYPCKNQIRLGTQTSLGKFLRPEENPRSVETSNSVGFIRLSEACGEVHWYHDRSIPHTSETKRTAQRAVRRVKESTSTVLVQFGLQESWWASGMECYCCLPNVQDHLADSQTPYFRRFNSPLVGPIGSMWGIFIGYAVNAEGSWTGNLLIVDRADLKTLPPSEMHVKNFRLKNGGNHQEKQFWYFHVGRAKFCKKDRRHPPLCTKRPVTSGENLGKIVQKKRKNPEIQVKVLKLDKISGALWEIPFFGIMLLQERNSMFRRTIFGYF